MIKKIIAICLAMIIPLAFAACAAPAASDEADTGENTATITVSPGSGAAATPLTVTGAGFKPGETVSVEIVIGDVTTALGKVIEDHEVSDDGTFTVTSAIPHKKIAAPGVYPIIVTGDKGSRADASVEVTE